MKLMITKKIFSRFRDKVSGKCDFMAFGHYRDRPPAWELLKEIADLIIVLIV